MYSLERLLGGEREQAAGVDRPLDHLVACHNRIEERLRVIERALEHLEDTPGEARAALDSAFRYFDTSGILHTEDEEQSVFPRLRGRLTGEEAALLDRLEQQHREAEQLYGELKREPQPALAARFCALYREHIEAENHHLIAAARRVLNPGDLAAISREMHGRRSR